MRLRKRLVYWKYKRRAAHLDWLIKTLGVDHAVDAGFRRGWIDRYEDGKIYLRESGFIR